MRVLINDKIVSRDEALVDIEDREYQSGLMYHSQPKSVLCPILT